MSVQLCRYEGLIFDPPAFGRGGPKNREWQLAKDLPVLASKLENLLRCACICVYYMYTCVYVYRYVYVHIVGDFPILW